MDDEPKEAVPVSEPPLDPKAPPNLRLGLRDRPEVKALLAELSQGLKDGEDPLFYELPDSPPDDLEACAPNEARVYVGPTKPPLAHHKTLELDRVKIAAAVRAPKEEASPWSAQAARTPIDKAALPSAMGPEAAEAAHEDAPPMSRPTVVSTRRGAVGAGGKRSAAIGAAVAAAVLVVLAVAALRGPSGGEPAAATASVSATAPRVVAPSVTAMPSPRAVPSTAPSPSPSSAASAAPTAKPGAPPSPSVKRPNGARNDGDDPYGDAAPPSPPKTAAPVDPPPPPLPPAKSLAEDKPVF